jgi:hypothetical protein
MPTKKPSQAPIKSSSAAKKTSTGPAAAKKANPKADDAVLDEDELMSDEDLDEDLDDEDAEDDDEKEADAVTPVEEEVEKAVAEDEEEEEDPINEEEILAKGDDLEILNLLAKKANRLEKGLDEDELMPDEEGMNSF